MIQTIEKIQKIINESSQFSDEEKKKYYEIFESFKQLKETENLKKIFTNLLTKAESNPEAIKEFINGIREVLTAFYEKGIPGLLEKLK